jgi:hypothetical protein
MHRSLDRYAPAFGDSLMVVFALTDHPSASECSIFKISRLDPMKDDYVPINALRFRRVSFLYARRYNGVSVSAPAVSERKWSEGVWKERG